MTVFSIFTDAAVGCLQLILLVKLKGRNKFILLFFHTMYTSPQFFDTGEVSQDRYITSTFRLSLTSLSQKNSNQHMITTLAPKRFLSSPPTSLNLVLKQGRILSVYLLSLSCFSVELSPPCIARGTRYQQLFSFEICTNNLSKTLQITLHKSLVQGLLFVDQFLSVSITNVQIHTIHLSSGQLPKSYY